MPWGLLRHGGEQSVLVGQRVQRTLQIPERWLMQGLEDTSQVEGTYKEQVENKLASLENCKEFSVWLSAPKGTSFCLLPLQHPLETILYPPNLQSTSLNFIMTLRSTCTTTFQGIPAPAPTLTEAQGGQRGTIPPTGKWYRIGSFSDYLLLYQHNSDKGVLEKENKIRIIVHSLSYFPRVFCL